MALRILVPTERIFFLAAESGEEALVTRLVQVDSDKKEATVAFRQGTNGDNEIRNSLVAQRKFRLNADEGGVDEVATFNELTLAKMEVALTMTACDIEGPDGKALEFEEHQGIKKVKSAQFETWWRALPPGWATGLYKCCLEVNPLWGTKS